MFGKAIGNGYAINAIIGKRKYMKMQRKLLLVAHSGQRELERSSFINNKIYGKK